jgi:signal transduction histidine kinase/DNA-binding response OmpR family regulator
MKRSFLLLLLSAFSCSLLGQQKIIDSLYRELKSHPERDSNRVKLLYKICYYEKKIDHKKIKPLATEALQIANEVHFRKGIGWSQKYLAGYYRENGDYALAIEHAFEMLKAFEGTTNAKGWGQSYQCLGVINQEAKNPAQAKIYFLKAVDIFKKGNEKLDLFYLYNCLGTLAVDVHHYEEALAYQLEALKIHEELNNDDDVFIYATIGTNYKLLKNYPLAITYFQKELPRLESSPFKELTAPFFIELGDLFRLMGDYKQAEANLLKATTLARAVRHKRILTNAYDKLMQLESTRGNYKGALTYEQLSNQYKDSLFTEEKSKQMAELEVRYQSQQKDQAIQALTQQKQIQTLKQWLLVGMLILALLIFLAIFFLQRSHNKKVGVLLSIQQSLNQKLQESDRMKSTFFANISHELRTPLTLILAPIEKKLATPRLNVSDRQSFKLIERNAKRLLVLINQLLDLSKLEARKMELHIQQGDLKKLFTIFTASFESFAQAKQVNFHADIDISSDLYWYDADKLEKMVSNLLSNAIKFTPVGGQVTCLVRVSADEKLKIEITDNGIGIPQEDQEFIFTPFYRSTTTSMDDSSGTGLGLPMVKELVHLHGGVIQLVSSPAKGTSIFIDLPVSREAFPSSVIVPSEMKSITRPVVGQEGDPTDMVDGAIELADAKTILIVEDNPDLRAYISSLLTDAYKTITANDGEQGFLLATEHVPDLILSDVMMPLLDGISLTQKIKRDERTSHIPVVLLTARADDESKLEGLQVGADDYLLKPFSVTELRIRVFNLIEQRKKLAARYRSAFSTSHVIESEIEREPSMDEKFLSRVKAIVEEHIADTRFSVEQLAGEVHLSRAQLFRKLKAICSLSPNEFINEIRLQKAAELIRLRVDELTQISYRVGFNEQSYFAKRFKKKFGITPSEYKSRFQEIAK